MQQRWISILAIVLGLQVALAVALGLQSDRLAPGQSDALLIAADLKNADKLAFDGPKGADKPAAAASAPAEPDRLELVKRDGKWLMPLYHDAPADAAKVQGLLDKLSHVKRGFAVAKTSDARQRFKVADNEYERRIVVSAGDKPLATAYLGTAPAMRKVHARTAQDDAVFAVDLTPQDAELAPKEWLDTDLLQVNAAAMSEITVTAQGKPAVTLVKAAAPQAASAAASATAAAASAAAPAASAASAASAVANATAAAASAPASAPGTAATETWQVKNAAGAVVEADSPRVTTLVNAIANLRVDGVLGTQPKPEWQQDTPELSLSFKNAQGQPVTWVLSKQKSGQDYVLKASDRPWFLELKQWAARPVLDAAVPERLLGVSSAAPPPVAASGIPASTAVTGVRPATAGHTGHTGK